MIPVMMLSATAEESYSALANILDEKIVNPLNRIEGVGAISLLGSPTRAVQVDVDPKRLEAYNLSVEQIAGIIRAENFNLPSGKVEMGMIEFPLRVKGQFTDSEQIKNIVLGNFNNKVVYLKDVATVNDTLKNLAIYERTNGRQSVRLMVQKQSGANTVNVAKKVNKELAKLTKELPPDIKLETIFDSSDFIVKSINNLSNTLLFAGIFVILVVLFFLGRWRATFIVILTIPVSLISAFIYIFISGNTINIISLSSLAIAIGMVVDDAIVVLENITKHIERGSPPREASIYGTNEVGLAVIATTLTVVAVFLPMTMVGGLTGIMFKQFGWIVSITITVSTLAALSLTPMLSSKLLRLKKTNRINHKGSFTKWHGRFLSGLDNYYEKTLHWAVRHKAFVIILSVVIFLGSIGLIPLVGTEFMPPYDSGRISVAVELTEGVRIEETRRVAREIEAIMENKYPEIELISTSAGTGEGSSIIAAFQKSGTYIINFSISLTSEKERDRSIFDIADLLREDLSKFSEITTFNVDPGSMSMMMGGGNVEVDIFGYDLDKTYLLAEELARRMEDIKGTRDILISRDKEKPELQIILDREKMASLGLNTATVATIVRNRISGSIATKFREEGEEYDVIVKYADENKTSLADIENINIRNPYKKNIKLKEVGTIEQFFSPPNIDRKNRVRYVTVSALLHKTDLGTITKQIKNELATIDIPPDIDIEIGGSAKDMQDTFHDLAMLLVLSIVLVYIVMASQFESFREPFIIMFSLPFAFTGVFLALFITGTTLSAISFIGGIMLVGIVVKNAIIMVDYTNLMRDRGLSIVQSVVVAGKSRLRPVLMTTFTTLLAMLPLAVSQGEGASMWRPMGVSIIGGLLFSTIVTLILIPVIYSLFGAARLKKTKKATLKATNNIN